MLPKTQYADSGGHSIAYQVIGSGPIDVFFAQGLLSHLDLQWCDPIFAGFLNQLASISRLIIADQRGVGLSDACATIPTIDERVADMLAVADAVGTEHMYLLGHCHGGPPSIVFAATYPRRVTGLVLMSTFAKGQTGVDGPGAVSAEAFKDWMRTADNWGEGQSLTYFNPSRAEGRLYRQLYATFERAAMSRGMARAAVACTREIDVSAALETIGAPALVLHCSNDFMSVDAARQMAAKIPNARFVELEGADHAPFMGAGSQEVVDNIVDFIGGSPDVPALPQRFGAILMTDIVASTEAAGRLGDTRWADMLARHDSAVRDAIDRHNGDCIKFTGDGYLATFPSCEAALRCAIELQRTARDFDLTIRCGVHAGGYQPAGHDVIGVNVITTSRLMTAARGSEILVSDAVLAAVTGAGFEFSDRRSFTLKGLLDNVFAAELQTEASTPRWHAESAPDSPSRTRLDRIAVAGAKRFPHVARVVFAKAFVARHPTAGTSNTVRSDSRPLSRTAQREGEVSAQPAGNVSTRSGWPENPPSAT